MTIKLRLSIIVFLCCYLNVNVFASDLLSGDVSASDAIKIEAPDFTLKSRQGNIKLSELKGQVVVLNFWASWCGPCRQEMPLLNKVYQRTKDLGVIILGVNLDKNTAKSESFLRDIPVDFPIVFDPENQVTGLYGVEEMPSSIFLDRDGMIRYQYPGYRDGNEGLYEQKVRELAQED